MLSHCYQSSPISDLILLAVHVITIVTILVVTILVVIYISDASLLFQLKGYLFCINNTIY